MMIHLKDHIEILKSVLQDICVNGLTIPKATIYDAFNKIKKTDIEKYRFSKEISKLIQDGHIEGYKIKVGRNGGVSKNENPVKIRLIYPNGDVIRTIDPESLQKILSILN